MLYMEKLMDGALETQTWIIWYETDIHILKKIFDHNESSCYAI